MVRGLPVVSERAWKNLDVRFRRRETWLPSAMAVVLCALFVAVVLVKG